MTEKEQKKIEDLTVKVTKLQELHPDLWDVAWELWHLLSNEYLLK